MTAAAVLGIIGFGISILALVIAVSVARRLGHRDPLNVPRFWRRVLFIRPRSDDHWDESAGEGVTRNQRIAFVVNPTKNGVSHLREQAMRACAIRYLPQPMWFYTTEEDPGTGQTRKALEQGADVVVAVGGDGTVRAVSEALVDSGSTLGIIPMGTGNLFARNLEIPLGDPQAALRNAIEGEEQLVDIGWLDVTRQAGSTREDGRHLFLVIAGAGIDAEMVGGADDRLKKRLGWFAYFFAASTHMFGKRMQAMVQVDDTEAVTSHMRTVLMANVGRLPAGIQLVPDASAWDGQLDVATLDARGGIVGWTELFGTVVAQGAGIKEPWVHRRLKTSRIDHVRGKRVEVRFAQPQKVQVDGEAIGRARKVVGHVHPKAFKVRVPPGVKQPPRDKSKDEVPDQDDVSHQREGDEE